MKMIPRSHWSRATGKLAMLQCRVYAQRDQEPLTVRYAVEAALDAVECNRHLDCEPLDEVLRAYGGGTVSRLIEATALENAEAAIYEASLREVATPEQKERALMLIREALAASEPHQQEVGDDSCEPE